MESFNLHSVDQDFGHCISHTYEKSGEGGCVQSWLDHIMISRHYTSMITDVSCIHLADNFSDHLPLVFQLTLSQTISHSSVPSKSQGQSSTINWSTISEQNVEVYRHLVTSSLPHVPQDLIDCSDPNCTIHRGLIDSICSRFLACLDSCARSSFVMRADTGKAKSIPGWSDQVLSYQKSARFWNKLWVDAGCPSTGVLFEVRKIMKAKYKINMLLEK